MSTNGPTPRQIYDHDYDHDYLSIKIAEDIYDAIRCATYTLYLQ